MMKSLLGYVCIVTGASRGIGKGIALQLAEAGAKVYITGRTLKTTDDKPGSLMQTAEEVSSRGGECIPVQCDHAKDDQVEALFKRVSDENDGKLDILVNNAYSAVNRLLETAGQKFWQIPYTVWDEVNRVGLRNHYVCAWHAAQMMVPRKSGLIVNVSSIGGLQYLFNVPYGVGKEACDRMAVDCAVELRKSNVAFVSLWPGAVQTEVIMEAISKQEADSAAAAPKDTPKTGGGPSIGYTTFPKTMVESGHTRRNFESDPRAVDKRIVESFKKGETIEYSGKCLVALASDPTVMKKSGKVLLTCDLADEYGLTDIDGRQPPHIRKVSVMLEHFGWTGLAQWFPGFVKVPRFAMALGGNKL